MILKLTTEVYAEVDDGSDPEEVAAEFASGYKGAIEHWPGGDVVHADVTGIAEATDEEIERKGLTE